MNKLILCVEDNEAVQSFNKQLLEASGYRVVTAATLAAARSAIEYEAPALIILDIHMPDGNGLDFLLELRKSSSVPVIVLSGDGKDQDMVTGFDSGCDDYVPKPYAFPVLLARIESLLRRASRVPNIIVKGSLRLDVLAGQAFIGDTDMMLAQKEFSLLLLFALNEGLTLNTDFLYERVWGQPMMNDSGALRNALSRFRKKLTGCEYEIIRQGNDGYTFKREKL